MLIIFSLILLSNNLTYEIVSLYVQPLLNPLELIPIVQLPICISQPFTNNRTIKSKTQRFQKCVSKLGSFQPVYNIDNEFWCHSNLSTENISLLSQFLGSNSFVHYASGSSRNSISLGPNLTHIFSHFSFILGNKSLSFNYLKIQASKPIPINSSSIDFFIIQLHLIQTIEKLSQKNPKFNKYHFI